MDTKDNCIKECSAETCVAYEWGLTNTGNKCTTFEKPADSKLVVKVQEAQHYCFIKQKAATQETSTATFNTATNGKCVFKEANPFSNLKKLSSETVDTTDACSALCDKDATCKAVQFKEK